MKNNSSVCSTVILSESLTNLITAHIRKIDIQEDSVDGELRSEFQAFVPRVRTCCLESAEVQQLGQSIRMLSMVIDNEYSNMVTH
jgi:hypothetical protein